jgi:hypothetical protein
VSRLADVLILTTKTQSICTILARCGLPCEGKRLGRQDSGTANTSSECMLSFLGRQHFVVITSD